MMQVMFLLFPQYSTYFSFANKSSWGNSVFIPEGKAKVINESIGLSMSVLSRARATNRRERKCSGCFGMGKLI